MSRFVAIWAGQLVSLLGSAITGFALAVWLYQRSGDVGDLALIAGALYLPWIVLTPYAGVLADRLDRRALLIAADAGSAIATAAMLWCASSGQLGPWSAAALVAAGSCCNALQGPAFEATLVSLVPKQHLGRAAGLVELSRGTSQLLAPVIAGALFGGIGLSGIIALDLISFAAGIAPLLVVRIPARPPPTARPSWFAELAAGWRLIAQRPGMVAMLALFSVTSFTFAVTELLFKPMILAFASPWELGVVLSSVGVGMVTGSLAMAVWGGPRHKVRAILLFQLLEGGALVIGGWGPSLLVIGVAAFAYGLVIPLTFGLARTIWQVKVPHALQGRVAALRNSIVMLAVPLGYLAATPLERALGPGPVIIAMGAVTTATALLAFGFAPYRRIEVDLADLLEPQPN